MISQIEKTILSAYLITESFSRTVTAHIEPTFFESDVGKVISEISVKYTKEHKSSPSKTTLLTILEAKKGLSEKVYSESVDLIDNIFSEDTINDIKNTDTDWLLKETETWCKQRSVFNAIIRSVDIIEGKDKEKLDKAAIPELMQKALAISFDSSIGHNYIDDSDIRYENLNKKVNKIPFRSHYLNKITDGGVEKRAMHTILAGTGCHAKGTEILLADGSIKKIEDITIEDKLLGDDGKPKDIYQLIRNKGLMYKIHNNSTGDEFIVNDEHILSLYNNESKKVVNVTVKDYLTKSNNFKHTTKMYYLKQPAVFQKNDLKLSPYFMGIYLGDGSTNNIGLTNSDPEVIDYFKTYINDNYTNATIRVSKKDKTDCCTYHVAAREFTGYQGGYNVVGKDFAQYGLNFNGTSNRTKCGDKFIPHEYKTSSIEDRLELLAGIIDTDGYYGGDNRKGYEVVSKSKRLAYDVKFVAQSLAMMAKVKEKIVNGVTYYRVAISESFTSPRIPCKVPRKVSTPKERNNPLHTSFTVEELGVDDYYGFTISGNHLYCMANFCVTHNTGKSMLMTSLAADYISTGHNVLYITLEMSEEKISHRVDANLLDVDLGNLKQIPKDTYLRKFDEFRSAGYGKLIVKEYPTSSASCANFRFLLQELEVKQGFRPDIVFLDYLGITLSARFKTSDNMYQVQKSVAEEFRGLAVERDFVAWTASQINRSANGNVDFDMDSISESFGVAMSCDMILGLSSSDELVQLKQIRVKQLKNRYTDLNFNTTYLMSVDRPKMRIYDDGRETLPYKKVTQSKFNNIINTDNKEVKEDDKPFVFHPSMIRPKKDYSKIGQFDGL